MNWKRFLGEARYEKLRRYCEANHQSVAAVVRQAIDKFVR